MSKGNGKPAILIDIDGVICNTDYKPTPEKFDWEKFMEAEHHPIEPGIRLVQGLINAGLYPVFLTARPEFMREQTEKMLADLGFHGVCYMASNETAKGNCHENYQQDQMEEKDRILFEEGLTEEFDFLYAIDDQELNAKMFKAWGIPTLKAMFL
jgi:hypothetical protein